MSNAAQPRVMTAEAFRRYQGELGHTHKATAQALGMSEISVKRYASGAKDIPMHVACTLRAIVLLHRLGALGGLQQMD